MPRKNKKRTCIRCGEKSSLRINGEHLCSKHADEELANMNAHREPRLVKMKALDDDLDLRTVLAKAGFRT